MRESRTWIPRRLETCLIDLSNLKRQERIQRKLGTRRRHWSLLTTIDTILKMYVRSRWAKCFHSNFAKKDYVREVNQIFLRRFRSFLRIIDHFLKNIGTCFVRYNSRDALPLSFALDDDSANGLLQCLRSQRVVRRVLRSDEPDLEFLVEVSVPANATLIIESEGLHTEGGVKFQKWIRVEAGGILIIKGAQGEIDKVRQFVVWPVQWKWPQFVERRLAPGVGFLALWPGSFNSGGVSQRWIPWPPAHWKGEI